MNIATIYSQTAKTQYRKLETNIPRKGTARLQSHSYIPVSVSDMYIPLIGLPILLQENRNSWIERGNIIIYIAHRNMNVEIGTEAAQSGEYINHSQRHECRNWEWGRAVPLLGTHKSKFLCNACTFQRLICSGLSSASAAAMRTIRDSWKSVCVTSWQIYHYFGPRKTTKAADAQDKF